MTQLTERVGFFAKSTTKICVLSGALWLGGLAWFYSHLQLRPAPLEFHSGGIVVLTGGQNRLETGIDLLKSGVADRLLISGVHPDTYLVDISKRLSQDISGLADRIDLGKTALDTVGNADEAAAWATEHHFKSLRIVTANYHMPRAMVEFHRAMPHTRLLPHPVQPYDRSIPRFAARPLTFGFIVLEYHKYLFSLIRARLAGDLVGAIGLPAESGLSTDLAQERWLEI